MKAACVKEFGPPSVIQIDDVEVPRPGAGQVLVKVDAAGVGPWDGWIRAGKSVLPQPLPLTLGSDLAGTVEALGPGVSGFAIGDAVFGVTNPRFTGAYAEHALAEAAMIARRPAGVPVVQAASAPVVAVTALQMLEDHAHVSKGQRVLILGGAGNVGSYAVQLARLAGAQVIAAVRGPEAEAARKLGAHEVTEDVSQLAPVDAVIDTVGGDLQPQSLLVIKRGGVLITAVSQPDAKLAEQRGVRAAFILVKVTTAALERIGGLLANGQLRASVGTILPLSEARTAHEMLEGIKAHPPGKIVLQIQGSQP